MMYNVEEFEEIRPYCDEEINPALKRIIAVPAFDNALDFLFPGQDKNRIKAMLSETCTVSDFQLKFMHPLVNSILKQTSKGLTFDGFEHLTRGTPYLFVGNHRDIVLDSAILQILLSDNKHATSEITFGSNLMINQFIIDLGKVNRMFKVYRGGNKIERFRNSKLLSNYIRYTLTQKHSSIWIAQRNGRTKDGSDKTESGVFKMFNFSGTDNFYESFKELNIVPLAISYEYEPCCDFKIREIYASLEGPYRKKPDEDFQSILNGITQPKGRIHLSVGKPVNDFLIELESVDTNNNKMNRLVELFDAEIYRHYKLWPNNYIAYDLLLNRQDYRDKYTEEEKSSFLKYAEKIIRGLAGEKKILDELLLKIYANPLINFNRLQ